MLKTDPFFGPAPDRIPLPRAPLVGVLAQVKFEEIFSITKKEFIADFQERIRASYPHSQIEQSLVLHMSPDGMQQKSEPHWRFVDKDKKWRVTLTTTFLALETREYKSRDNFIDRFGKLVTAAEDTINPMYLKRIGLRYVDRIMGEPLKSLERMVCPELVGLASSTYQEFLTQSLHESLCKVAEGQLLARWGLMRENASHDPEMMPPVNVESWMLDIDVFKEFTDTIEVFDAISIKQKAYDCATRAYTFFRWATTTEFLQTYGGKL